MQKPLALILTVLALWGATPTIAQQTAPVPLQQGRVVSPILTIDSERMFFDSAFGKRAIEEYKLQLSEFGKENRQIEADLEAEEKALTHKRPNLTPTEFRDLADAFDQKAQETRATQRAKERVINEKVDRERDVFLRASLPVMDQLMREAGASVVLERRSVFVSASSVEITQDAIALLDETLGSGAD